MADDDIILSAGYRISPFDIESIIAADPAVAEVAVVGRRHADAVSGEVIEAFVILVPQAERSGLDDPGTGGGQGHADGDVTTERGDGTDDGIAT